MYIYVWLLFTHIWSRMNPYTLYILFMPGFCLHISGPEWIHIHIKPAFVYTYLVQNESIYIHICLAFAYTYLDQNEPIYIYICTAFVYTYMVQKESIYSTLSTIHTCPAFVYTYLVQNPDMHMSQLWETRLYAEIHIIFGTAYK